MQDTSIDLSTEDLVIAKIEPDSVTCYHAIMLYSILLLRNSSSIGLRLEQV